MNDATPTTRPAAPVRPRDAATLIVVRPGESDPCA